MPSTIDVIENHNQLKQLIYFQDGGLIDNALSGALGNHVFGQQHIQQLQG